MTVPGTPPRLSRSDGAARQAAPIRLVHLGLGNFFRAHQAWFTERAPDAQGWGYAAFAGRGNELAATLTTQDGLYTLLERGPVSDTALTIASVSEAHVGADHTAWLETLASAQVAAITMTVTEAGYCLRSNGGLDADRSDVTVDVGRLRADITAPVTTAPGRLVAGLAARRFADSGPVALVPCDNVPGNGQIARRVVADFAELVEPGLADWIDQSVTVVTTVVDRITPRLGAADIEMLAKSSGRCDLAPVVTEPFSEWILAGAFTAGRPRWEDAGARFVDDVTTFEHRKLWLLNGAHSLLAYSGSLLGRGSVAEAIADDRCREWVKQWWEVASLHLEQSDGEVATYENALLERFANARMRDDLSRIAEDGSQKLPIRVLPVLRAERAAGRLPYAATRILAAWLCHLRGLSGPVRDVRARDLVAPASGDVLGAARQIIDLLDPPLGGDEPVVAAVAEQCEELAHFAR